ncbi:MAG TPA: class I SAM-dependent methyltransferase [Pyrinomonadaceae bacterium]|nr:class I SAM-dependent methyltransferase [Pyrinomonadaceae bacterium]
MSERESSLKEFLSVSKDFFQSAGGSLLRAFHGTRRNIEILDASSHTEVDVCCLEVEFEERNRFGEADYLDAYERYRQMRSDWWAYLESNKFRQWDASTSIISHFIPYLGSASARTGTPYNRESTKFFGQVLIPYERVEHLSSYYDEIHERYGVRWLLQDGRGITIGPDVGLLFGLIAALKDSKGIDTFIDLGAGTGELSAYLINKGLAKNIYINEVSQHLREHLHSYLEELSRGKEVSIDYQFTDASEFVLPERADVVSMGIYYGAQPFFLERHGQRLREALGPEGLLMIQSGMLENRFNISSVTGDDERLLDWPWYNERCCLKTYFSEIESVFVADEIITLACNSGERMARVRRALEEEFEAVSPPPLKEISPD